MEKWFIFRAFNTESVHGYGSLQDADRYVDHLNSDREINMYGAYEATADEIATLGLDDPSKDIGFNLDDLLRGGVW